MTESSAILVHTERIGSHLINLTVITDVSEFHVPFVITVKGKNCK